MGHLFLDLDGTLTDPAPGILACFEHAAAELGVPLVGDVTRFIGPPLQVSFAEILGTDATAAINDAIVLYRDRFARVGLFENSVYPGIPAALDQLRQGGFSLRVVTSKPHVYADRIVDHFGLREFFPVVYGPELDGRDSNKADLLRRVLLEESAEPSSSFMIGDRRHDVLAARANAVRSLGVLWGYGSRAELEAAGVDRLVAEVAGLQPALRDLLES